MVTKKIKREIKYSPSVNIVRDNDVELNYILTANSKNSFTQLVKNFNSGIHSFCIVGAYGTGKSAFLWALEKNINNKRQIFPKHQSTFGDKKSYEFIGIVGQFSSIIDAVAEKFGCPARKTLSTKDIITAIDKRYKSLSKANQGLAIIVDEFGKFLEYAAKNNPEKELFFIQELAEYVNDNRKNILFITTLHQDFNGYARGLTTNQQNEWDKVKGRLKELTFNEPVEQLLFLASERISELSLGEKDGNFKKLFNCIETSKSFPLRDYFNEQIAEKLIPFDILSASVLTLSLQKYGQNERSLFSFIESNDILGINEFNTKQNPYYNIACVYDYLIQNYYSLLTTKFNPHYAQWAAIRTALESAEGLFEDNSEDALKLIKTIGLLNIFALASAKINDSFLEDYGKYSLGIKNPQRLIKALKGYRIIRFVNYSQRYILTHGTDVDIEMAIDEAGNLVERVSDIVGHLTQYFEFPYISAKSIYFEKGTPRFFQFHLSEKPEPLSPSGEIDGYINLVFSDKKNIREEMQAASRQNKEAVLFGWYKNTNEIKNLLFEIEKIKKVKEIHHDDKIAVREFDSIMQHQIKLLNYYVLGNIYSGSSNILWFDNGRNPQINSRKSLNKTLSHICGRVYSSTPTYRNEMINKTNYSSQISTARRILIKLLTEKVNIENLGFEDKKFPPEKTIYLSLLRETGIHRKTKDGFILSKPSDESFSILWKECKDFLFSTRHAKRKLSELIDKLNTRPYKLKKGFLDFWMPIFLLATKDDFALYDEEDFFIPEVTEDTLDLIIKSPHRYSIKAFNLDGVRLGLFNKYRNLLNQSYSESPNAKSFIETIKPFLTFYRGLPEYGKKTKQLSPKAIALRIAISESKDPEKTFFDEFPKALGYDVNHLQKNQESLEKYVEELRMTIKEIRSSYDVLLNRFEKFILNEIIGEKLTFEKYKARLQNRFSKLKHHFLLQYQRVFMQRLNSELNDRISWLNSIAQGCTGKTLEVMNDDDEKILYFKFKEIIHELDNLCEISKEDIDFEKEEVFKLEITSFVEGIKKNLIRLPKNKSKDAIALTANIASKLTDDKQLNISILAKLLQKQFNNEK